jgi:hypothetical protein
MRRRREDERGGFERILEPFQFHLKIGLPLGFAVQGELAADGAGMPAVEGVGNGGGEAFRAGIVGEHRGPGHRLQHGEMAARGAQQRQNQQPMANAAEHGLLFSRRREGSQAEGHTLFYSLRCIQAVHKFVVKSFDGIA